MEKGKKCPNCGYISTQNEEFCPQCDRFEPTFEDFTKELTAQKAEKLKAEQEKLATTPNQERPVESQPEAMEKVEANQAHHPLETPPTMKPEKENQVIDKFVPSQSTAAKMTEATPQPSQTKTESTPAAKLPEKKPMNKKLVVGMLLAILLIGGGYFGYTKYQAKQESKQIAALDKQLAHLENNLNKLYLNEERLFLSSGFSQSRLEDLENELKTIKDETKVKELSPLIADLKERASLQTGLNDVFTETVMTGDQLNTQAILKEGDVTIPQELAKPKDEFEQLINQGILLANTQKNDNQKVKELMALVFDKEVKKELSRKAYDDAKASLAKLKNPELRKVYEEQLQKVETQLNENEKAQLAQKVEEERQQAIQAEANRVAQANQPVYNQGGTQQTGKKGIALANEGSGTQEGDWSWAPGVQEKVINICLERGYMVQGGYELRPRTIINGEAYYDLYATTTTSSLLKNRSVEELPIYLVTINAKTGWFKGEGPN